MTEPATMNDMVDACETEAIKHGYDNDLLNMMWIRASLTEQCIDDRPVRIVDPAIMGLRLIGMCRLVRKRARS